MQNLWQQLWKSGLGAISILKLRQSLLKESRLSQNFLILTISSCCIATFGLLNNSAAVIIGAMIIAPLMLPLRGLPFAMLEGDRPLLRASLISILVASVLPLGVSWLIGILVIFPEFGSEVFARSQPTLIDLLIAIVAGGVGGYAKIQPKVGDTIPGIAISVALMPPICVVGLALSQGELIIAKGAALLYMTNLLGINLSCLAIYVFAGYARSGDQLTRSLSWGISFLLMTVLAVPLGVSSWKLVNRARAEESVGQILRSRTLINRRDIRTVGSRMDWQTTPPTLYLVVRAAKPIVPEEVEEMELQLQKELQREFKVVFEVTQSQHVESNKY